MKKGIALLSLYPRITIFVVLLLLGGWGLAQIASPPAPTSSVFPGGAIVYLETRDAESLLKWWKGSQVKTDWEKSVNYTQFRNSRLYLKLRDRLMKWGSQGSFRFELDNLIQAAGDRTAIAVYDIGELKAVAATRISFGEAKTTQLWLASARFEQKKIGDHIYYREPRDGSLVFAYAEPYLIVASDESLLIRTLSNLDAPSQTLAQSQKWHSFQGRPDSDLSLYLDQQALQENRYFKKYWIHENVSDFAQIESVWIDLSIESDAIIERRHFIRRGADVPPAMQSTAGGSPAAAFRQFDYEALYIDTPITPASAATQILKFVNRLPSKDHKASYPPTFSAAAERVAQAETRNILLEQIDEPILEVKSETMLQPIQQEQLEKVFAATDPAAQIRLVYPLWDSQALFVHFPETLMLQLKNHAALDQKQFLQQILEHFLLLHATQDEGARWVSEPNGTHILECFWPLYVKFQSPWIVISTRESDFRQIVSNLPQNFVAMPYREVNWKTGRWKYTRLMQKLDHGESQEGVPLLFSENITSLLTVLDPIVASSVTETPTGEIIRYELR